MFFYTFFPELLNMNLTASVVIVLVLLVRLLLKKAPKVISYALWGIVLVRLLCPVSIESDFSLFRLLDTPVTESGNLTSRIEYVPNNIVHTENPNVELPVLSVADVINDVLPRGEEQLVADPLEAPMTIATYVWMAGILAMGIYAAVSYIRLRRKLVTASSLRDNIYLADDITSPFVMGLIRPKIYLPSSMHEQEQPYILMHEQHHIRRFDHIIKALAFVALCIHWFNPLVWIAFIMAGKDMEMSCDEAVVRKMGNCVLADYTASLLTLATGCRIIAGMPLAFGGGDPKGRIRNLAKWRKPALWVVLVLVIACAVLAVYLLTNPKEKLVIERTSVEKVTYYNQFVSDDCQGELNASQIDEMVDRFSAVTKAKRSNHYEGQTPGYQLCVFLKDGTLVYANGYNALNDNVEIVFEGKRYAVTDTEFANYLRNVCSAGDVSSIQEVKPEIEISVSDEIISSIPVAVIDYACEYTQTQLDYYTADLGYEITEAKITGITQINTGTAALDHSINLYRLEYRFLAAEPDGVMLAGGMQMDGDYITEWGSVGQPYLLLLCDENGNWTPICATNTLTMQEEYNTPEMLDKYGNMYTAAAMELYKRFAGERVSFPADAIDSLFTSGDIALTLNLAGDGAYNTYLAGEWFSGRFKVLLGGYKWTKLEAPSTEPSDFWLTAFSADGTKIMTFWATSGAGMVQYYDGNTTTFWSASPAYDYNESIAKDIRLEYDNLDVDYSRIAFYLDGSAEEAADAFVHSAYGSHMTALAPGSMYGMSDYDVVQWKVREISETGDAVVGTFQCAFTPWDFNSAGIWAGNTEEGTGRYQGKLIYYREFVLQRQEDGYWHCIGLGTGGYTLPE